MKKLCIVVLSIWAAGATVMVAVYTFNEKAECIKNEGMVKGLVWCESRPKTEMGFAARNIAYFIKGLFWPYNLAITISGKGREEENAYLCQEFVDDLNRSKGDFLESMRVMNKLSDGVFKDNDTHKMRQIYYSAQIYYGHQPSNDELKQFSAKSAGVALKICKNDGQLSVKQAMVQGADYLSENR